MARAKLQYVSRWLDVDRDVIALLLQPGLAGQLEMYVDDKRLQLFEGE